MATLKDYQDAIDRATSALISATNDAQTKLSALNRCNCGKGKVNGNCRPLDTTYTFPNLATTDHCKDPAPLDTCKTDCCSKNTCISKVNEYNASIGVYNAAVQALSVANKAKEDAIKTDPNIKKEQDNNYTKNIIIVVVIIAAVIAIGVWLWKKYGK